MLVIKVKTLARLVILMLNGIMLNLTTPVKSLGVILDPILLLEDQVNCVAKYEFHSSCSWCGNHLPSRSLEI